MPPRRVEDFENHEEKHDTSKYTAKRHARRRLTCGLDTLARLHSTVRMYHTAVTALQVCCNLRMCGEYQADACLLCVPVLCLM